MKESSSSKEEFKVLHEADFDDLVIESGRPVVLLATATWCGKCKALIPVFAEISASYEGKVDFMIFDVEQEPLLTKRLKIRGLPTSLFYSYGTHIYKRLGVISERNIRKSLDAIVSYDAEEAVKNRYKGFLNLGI